ncbi:MAG: hypothetical protein ACFFFH_06460 [Candidatus Thorarchaeota archaeon]
MSMKEYKQQVKDIQKSSLYLIQVSDKIQALLSQFDVPPISFEHRVIHAKKNLKLIYLTSTQRIIIDEITKELAALVPFHDFVIRGFLWRAIRSWQHKNTQPIITVAQMDRRDQFRIGIEILDHLKFYLSRAMYIPDKVLKRRYINEVIRNISEFYEELLAAQAFLDDPDNEEIILDHEIETWLESNSALFPLER